MKRIFITVILLSTIPNIAFAEGSMNMSGQIINSRIFSTQAAHQYETLERNNYNNSAIMQIENKNYEPTIYKKQQIQEKPIEEKGIKNLFKGFRIIY